MTGEFTQIVAGMTGAQLIDALNGNSNKTKINIEEILAELLLKVIGNNIKQIKSENGKLYYTLDGTNWISSDNNVWGSITGDILDQTDLNDLLATKANTSDLNTTNTNVNTLSNRVTGLSTTVASNTSAITQNSTAIGQIQTKQAKQVSSDTIALLRISSSGFMQYSLDGVTWINVQSIAEINWGAIGGEISNQQDLQQVLASKVNNSQLTAHTNNKNNPHEVTKAQVGLENVDNTSDADKPISTAAQTEFDAINGEISRLSNDKIDKTEDLTAIEYLTLTEYNARRYAGTLSSTTLYVVE